jgi:hypothetical protein
MTSPYPPASPTITGTAVSVDLWLQQPAYVQRAIEDLTNERFIADYIFAEGPPAPSGSVLYDQVTAAMLYAERDIQEIEPASEFPLLTFPGAAPLVANVKKWGGAFFVTDEQRSRNRFDVLARNLRMTRNTIVRKMDTVAVAALNAAPLLTQSASGDWSAAATDIIGDVETAKSAVEDADLGYVIDTALINPAQRLDLRKDADIRAALPRENRETNPLLTKDLAGLLELDWITSNRVPAGTIYLLQRQVVGSRSDEQPLTSEVIPDRRKQVTYIQAWRKVVPYVTDPKAAIKITGA